MDCPYCNKHMQNGVVEADGRQGLRWINDNQKISFTQRLFNEGKSIIAKRNLFGPAKLTGHRCDGCNKIIINLENSL